MNTSIAKYNAIAVLALSAVLAVPSAHAANIAVASQVSSASGFSLVNNGQPASTSPVTFGTTGGGSLIPVSFEFLGAPFSGSYAILNGAQAGSMTMTTTASTTATNSGGTIHQFLDAGTITITRNTPVDGKNVLLHVAFESADLFAKKKTGSVISQDEYDIDIFGSTHTVTYTSDFVNFSTATGPNWSLALSGITPPASILSANGLINSFAAAGTATFSVEGGEITVVPEPATYAMVFAALALGVAAIRRRCVRS
jgi:hypothetical protein